MHGFIFSSDPIVSIGSPLSHVDISYKNILLPVALILTCHIETAAGVPHLHISHAGDDAKLFTVVEEKTDLQNHTYYYEATLNATVVLPKSGEITCIVRDRLGTYSTTRRSDELIKEFQMHGMLFCPQLSQCVEKQEANMNKFSKDINLTFPTCTFFLYSRSFTRPISSLSN